MATIEDRLAALEAAVARLTRPTPAHPDHDLPGRIDDLASVDAAPETTTRFWMLKELERRLPDGAVGFAGHLATPDGPIRWQWSRPAADLTEGDWEPAATALAALGHPVRLRLLQLVLTGTTTTADLAEADGLGTTGQLHHHLRALVAAGWLRSTGRGRYGVPPQRVIPLLAVVAAASG